MAGIVRYGILSTAQIARNNHIPSAKGASNTEIVAISSRSKDKAEEWAGKLEIGKAYGSYDELLADVDIDAVINPLPNSMHCEWTVKAAEAGKHILVEKPFAVTVEEADKMIDAAAANNVLVMEGFTTQFKPEITFMRELIQSGELGEVLTIRSELTYDVGDWENDSRTKGDLAGGSLQDAGCYCVNLIRSLMGEEPVSAQAYRRVKMPNNVDSTLVGLLKFPGDRTAMVVSSMESCFRGCCQVTGSKGEMSLSNFFTGNTVEVTIDWNTRVETFDSIDRFKEQIEHFSDCILNDRAPRISTQDSRHNTAALVALAQAAEQGKLVHL